MSSARTITIFYIGFLALFLIVTFVFSSGRKEFYSAGENQETVSYLGSSPLLNFLKWDSLWYLRIAQQGYFSPESHAFAAPLFPFLIKLIYFVTHQRIFSALIINVVLLPLAIYAFIRLMRLDYPDNFSLSVILVLLSFPFSFFLFLPFTETLFLLLTFSAFYFARKSCWARSLILSFLASLTRYPGLIVLVSVMIEFLLARRDKTQLRKYETPVFLMGSLITLISLFLVWQHLGFLDPLNLLAVRQHWQVTLLPFPVSLLKSFVLFIRFQLSFPAYLFSYSLFFWAVTALSFKRLRPSYFFYLLLSMVILHSKQDFGLVPASGSLGRYLLTLFPAFIVLTEILVNKKILKPYLLISLILLIFNFLLFLSNIFVG